MDSFTLPDSSPYKVTWKTHTNAVTEFFLARAFVCDFIIVWNTVVADVPTACRETSTTPAAHISPQFSSGRQM